MKSLQTSVRDYLAMRRAMGFKLERHEAHLLDFVGFMQRHHARRITGNWMVRWVLSNPSTDPCYQGLRFGAVRGFAIYHSTVDPHSEVPPADLMPRQRGRNRFYLYSDAEIQRLLAETLKHRVGATSISRWVRYTLYGLLSVTGILALDPSTSRMSLPVLRKIRDLVAAGAVVVGVRPLATPSLADDAEEFQRLAEELWDRGPIGTGRIIADSSIADALYRLGVPTDFSYTGPDKDTEVLFTHRRTEDGDIYLLSSLGARARSITASFRVTGRAPQLWRADTGEIEPLSYRISQGRTHVPLTFDPHDAVFVVFRKKAAALSLEIPPPTVETVLAMEGAWQLSFPPGLGAPAQARFERLQSLTDSAHAGIKYFSGTVTYTKTLQATVDASRPGARLYLDLGTVREVAEVIINGKSMGVAWKPPYRVDVTPALRTGENRLQIKVSNLWRNRMIGDKQPGATPIAYATHDPFKADSPLLPSGLLGPVSLLQEK